jgi:hypothetical protein
LTLNYLEWVGESSRDVKELRVNIHFIRTLPLTGCQADGGILRAVLGSWANSDVPSDRAQEEEQVCRGTSRSFLGT